METRQFINSVADITKTIDCVKKQIGSDNAQRNEKCEYCYFIIMEFDSFKQHVEQKQMQVKNQIIP